MVEKSELNEQYWATLKRKSAFAGITLDDKISPEDFRAYGDRLAGRQIEMFRQHGSTPLETSTVVDVGCGLGRISLPYSRHFKKVIGIDINRQILDAGMAYCEGATNIEFIENDGKTIPLPDASIHYSYSGGVLQHIKDLDVIKGYFREGLRVLKPGGTLNYSIQTWMNDIVKGPNVGKKITASDVEEVLAEHDCELLAIIEDPNDPLPHMNLIIRMHSAARPVQARKRVVRSLVREQPVRTGIWEDLPSYQNFRTSWAGPRRAVTFWDPGARPADSCDTPGFLVSAPLPEAVRGSLPMSEAPFNPHAYLQERLDRITDTAALALGQLDDDDLLDRILEQKNAVIAKLAQTIEALTAGGGRAGISEGAVELAAKLQKSLAETQALKMEIDRVHKPSIARSSAMIASLNDELKRRWNIARQADASGRDSIRAEVSKRYGGIKGWDLRNSYAELGGWFVTHTSSKEESEAVAADLLFETETLGVHAALNRIDPITDYLPCTVVVLLKPNGRDFAAVGVASGGEHVAEGYFDLAGAAPIRARSEGGFQSAEINAERYRLDWVRCELRFTLAAALPALSIRIQTRRDADSSSRYEGEHGLGVAIADVQIGYRRVSAT